MAQQTAPRSTSTGQGTSTRRRTILLSVLLLVAIAGLVFVWRGSTNKSGSGASGTNHRIVAIGASKTATATSQHHTKSGPAKHKPAKPTATKKMGTSPVAVYAQQLLPVLDRSRVVFDNIASGAAQAGSDLSTLGTACDQYQSQLSILATRADGVPHPYPWWYRVGHLHHLVMGTYNNMLGALANCSNASQSGESDTAATSISDMGTADHRMRHVNDYAHWLAVHG